MTFSTASLDPGVTLGRYTLVFPLAQGGMGAVWAARARGADALSAVKVILPAHSGDPKFRAMFLDEARIAAAIDHPNVARIIDLGEDRGILFIAMDYVEGDSLAQLHNVASEGAGGLLPRGVVLRLVADACAGLHAAHELRDGSGALLEVVHRDMTPHNVLVSTEGTPKIVDFGIAKARGRFSGDTTSDHIKGKVCYIAREQALGERVDRRTDIWSIGSMLHYLLSGKHIFAGMSDTAVLFALLRREPIPTLLPPTPPEVAAVVARALAYDPDERFSTAEQMRQAILSAMRQAGIVTSTRDVAEHVAGLTAARAKARSEALARAAAALADNEAIMALVDGSGPAPVEGGARAPAQPTGWEPRGAGVTRTLQKRR